MGHALTSDAGQLDIPYTFRVRISTATQIPLLLWQEDINRILSFLSGRSSHAAAVPSQIGANEGMNRFGPGHGHTQLVPRNGREPSRGQGYQVLDTRYQDQYAPAGSFSAAQAVSQSQSHVRAPARPPLHRETQHCAVREHGSVHPSQAVHRRLQQHPAYAHHPKPQLQYHAPSQSVQHVHWQTQQRAPAPRMDMPSRAPNVYAADADQWAALRARGYVLQGSKSVPSVASMSASVGPDLHSRTPEPQVRLDLPAHAAPVPRLLTFCSVSRAFYSAGARLQAISYAKSACISARPAELRGPP